MIKVCHVCGEEFECGSAHRATTCDKCITIGLKYCNNCKRVLPVSSFGKLGKDSNKYKPKCKQCYTDYDNKRYSEDSIVRRKKIEASSKYCINRREYDDEYKRRCTENSRRCKNAKYTSDESYRAKVLLRGHI